MVNDADSVFTVTDHTTGASSKNLMINFHSVRKNGKKQWLPVAVGSVSKHLKLYRLHSKMASRNMKYTRFVVKTAIMDFLPTWGQQKKAMNISCDILF